MLTLKQANELKELLQESFECTVESLEDHLVENVHHVEGDIKKHFVMAKEIGNIMDIQIRPAEVDIKINYENCVDQQGYFLPANRKCIYTIFVEDSGLNTPFKIKDYNRVEPVQSNFL